MVLSGRWLRCMIVPAVTESLPSDTLRIPMSVGRGPAPKAFLSAARRTAENPPPPPPLSGQRFIDEIFMCACRVIGEHRLETLGATWDDLMTNVQAYANITRTPRGLQPQSTTSWAAGLKGISIFGG